jgi:hypothetical protein
MCDKTVHWGVRQLCFEQADIWGVWGVCVWQGQAGLMDHRGQVRALGTSLSDDAASVVICVRQHLPPQGITCVRLAARPRSTAIASSTR